LKKQFAAQVSLCLMILALAGCSEEAAAPKAASNAQADLGVSAATAAATTIAVTTAPATTDIVATVTTIATITIEPTTVTTTTGKMVTFAEADLLEFAMLVATTLMIAGVGATFGAE